MKDAVVSLVRESGARAEGPPAATSAPRPTARAVAFADLPAYRSLKMQRAAIELLGVSSPFFRAHDSRAGAVTTIAGREVSNFASYDYLGLNGHPELCDAAKAAIDRLGTSVSASRVVAGERSLHRELEAEIARVYGVDDAVVFVSGHATNVSAIGELMQARDLVIMDALIHNSAVVGAELSGAVRRTFPHNDLDALETILSETRHQVENALIVVEGLYSMDGDFPNLPRLIEIKRRYGCWLMVDEAHALGVLGATGRGTGEHFGIDGRDVDIWMGTLSKTCSSCGGYIAGSTALVEILKCEASGFVYSVGMSPPIAAAATASLGLMRREPERVARLRANGARFMEKAIAAGLDIGTSAGLAVIPVMVGDSLRATKLTERLLERGINVLPIIYPAVPMQSARLRFFLTSEHTSDQIDAAVAATAEELQRLVDENFGIASVAEGLASLAE